MATYQQLGKSGLRVSVPVVGGMAFGSPKWLPWVLPEDKGLELLAAAWELGINTIDTANAYSNGESERIIGDFMTKNKIPRENLVIMTKALVIVTSDISTIAAMDPHLANTREYVNQGGLSRGALFNQVEASLRRLQTSYIDLLQIHAADPSTPFEETMRAFHDLVLSGKVRYIGASNLKVWQFIEMNHIAEKNGWTQFTSIQIEHSLLYRAEEHEMFAYCKHKGIGILAYSPLSAGVLARPAGVESARSESLKGGPFEKVLRESDKKILGRVQELADRYSVSMTQIALEWSAAKVSSPIVGANSVERLKGAVISKPVLSQQDIESLEAPYEYQPPRV